MTKVILHVILIISIICNTSCVAEEINLGQHVKEHVILSRPNIIKETINLGQHVKEHVILSRPNIIKETIPINTLQNHPLLNKMVYAPIKVFIVPIRNGLLFCFQYKF